MRLCGGIAIAVAVAGCLATAPALASRDEYVVTIQGVRGGAMSVEQERDAVRVDFSWRDNGRGPDMKEEFVLGPGDRALTYRVLGKSMYGGEIREDFAFAEGRLRWNSVADRGDEVAPEASVFVPLQSTPAYWGQLVRSVLANADRSAPVGASGRLRVERLVQTEVEGPQGRLPVALYVLTGAEAWPWYVWLREDAGRGLFGVLWPGWHLTPAGHEGSGERLLALQVEAQNARLAEIERRAAQPLPGLTLIRNVRWFDAPAAAMRGPSDVYLFDGRIGSITAPGALQAGPQQVIDGSGSTLLPGLVDAHGHMWPEATLMHLAGGVTTVRDMANQNADLLLLKGRIDRGEIAGPGIVPAGFIEGKSPFSSRNGFVVDSVDAGLRAVDWYAARGYRQIKLYNSIKPDWVAPLAARAHRHGMTVAGHVPAFMRAEQAVRAGYDELTHINQVMLNFFVKPDQDTRTLLRFTLVGDEARKVRPESAAARRFLALLRKHGTAVDPTLSAFEAQFTQRDGDPDPTLADVADHLPVVWRRNLLSSPSSPTGPQLARWRESFGRMTDFVGAMHRAGVPLVAGTDNTPGLSLHRELALYVKAGIPPAQVLRIATWNGARLAGVGERTGSIARGKDADLVLVAGDPSQEIADVRRTRLVIRGGRAYAPETLYEALGMRAFAPAATVERLSVKP